MDTLIRVVSIFVDSEIERLDLIVPAGRRELMVQMIHAHDVMHMMLESGKQYTRDSFRGDLAERFGADARFHSCSVENMSADDLLEFLAQRGKLVGDPDGTFGMNPANMCQH